MVHGVAKSRTGLSDFTFTFFTSIFLKTIFGEFFHKTSSLGSLPFLRSFCNRSYYSYYNCCFIPMPSFLATTLLYCLSKHQTERGKDDYSKTVEE